MAQKTGVRATAKKITSPQNSVVFNGSDPASPTTTKDVGIFFGGESAVFLSIPARAGSTSTDDCLIQTSSGWKIEVIQEYADVVGSAGMSLTDLTNS